LIGRKDQKTDDGLKAVMPTHPWASAIIHGFYKLFGEVWKEEKAIGTWQMRSGVMVGSLIST
jgi:hypothetical protein